MSFLLSLFLTLCLFFIPALSPGAVTAQQKTLVIVGDSLTEGYGIAKESAYPDLLEKKLGNPWKVINSGVSGSTSASAPSRMEWALKSKPDGILLALGANDGLRGFSVKSIEENLLKAIRLAKKSGVKIFLAGIQMPPNYGKEYSENFRNVFPKVAKMEKIPLLPFLLKDVGGVSKLNLADGIHPNEEGHKIMAQTVYEFLKDKL